MKHHIAYSPLDGTLVNHRVTPQQHVVVTHLYTWVRRDRVKWRSLYKDTTQWVRLVDLHLPCVMSFQYNNSHDYHDNHCINEYLSDKCFSALNCNIRSLSANFDNLQHMLYELYQLPFSIVWVSLTLRLSLKVSKVFYPVSKCQVIHSLFDPVF